MQVGAFYFISQYLVLKWGVLRLYRKPPQYAYTLIRDTLGWMEVLLILLVGMPTFH